MNRLRVGVVGVGVHGSRHAHILSRLPGVELIAVVDTNTSRANEIARSLGTRAYTDAADLQGLVDAAVVSVPTESHHEVALRLLALRIPILVEKPMARTVAEADEMIEAARDAGVPLMVGQLERFNPAIEAIRPLLNQTGFVEIDRLSLFPSRGLDVDVVFDVMIHDLDMLLWLLDCDVTRIDAVGVPVLSGKVDIASVRLAFENGCIANLTSSRISKEPVRKIRFFQPSAYLSVDYSEQTVEQWTVVKDSSGQHTLESERLAVIPADILTRELEHFVRAVSGKHEPLVDGAGGRRALALAEQIASKIRESTPLSIR